jgi:PilZ domain
MTNAERRRHTRVAGPYDGSWSGVSGLRQCRITDLSPGGCFVDSFTSAEPGTSLTLTLSLDDRQYALPAEVVYVDRVQGFGVRFAPSEGAVALANRLQSR